MSGLCGWYQKNNQNSADEKIIEAMLDKIVIPASLHRSQAFSIDNSTCAALATADFTEQDIFNSSKLMVACTGHIHWKDAALTSLAQDKGNAAVIAQLYQQYGIDLLKQSHNDFALAIIDREQDKTILALDRMGIQRLCYQTMGDAIIFSSDMQAIFVHPASTKALSEQGVFNYFYFHMVPSPGAIYKNVEKLLPGQYIVFSKGQIEKHFYWQIAYQDNNTESFEELSEQFKKLLRDVVKSRLSEQTTGAFLSGGLDSSTMSGILSELQETADTFSIGFDADGYDETPFARTTAKQFNTHHHEYYVTPEDVFKAIPLIAQTYDEPFGNASAIPAYYCAKFARENGIHTMIGGDGGDEIFAGNERYAKQKVFEVYKQIPAIVRAAVLEPVFLKMPGATSLPVVKKINSYIQQAKIPLPARFETYNFLNRTPLDTIFDGDFLSQVNSELPLAMQEEVYNRTRSENSLHKMLHLDMKVTIADNDIRKVNNMCALAGVDVVYPFLDDDMVNFAAGVPPELKLKGQDLRYFFKQSLADYLPHDVINKQKHGFGLPFGVWLNDYKPLHEMAHESLLTLEQRGFFHKDYINNLWQAHNSEHSSYYGVMIWVMMMFEQWLEAHA